MSTEQDEIWQHATEEQVENVPETPTEAPEEAPTGRTRDDKGRFAKADPEPTSEEAPVEAPPETQLEVEKEDARIPSWRLKEESDRRREAELQLQQMRDEMRQMQMQWMAMQRPQEPQTPQEAPDIFADPQGFISNLQKGFDDRLRTLQLENSLRFAHYQHGEQFNEAYNALDDYVRQTGDRSMAARITAAPDPGEAIVQWYKGEQLNKELGGSDLNTFLEKKKQEWMSDPAFQAKVIEAFKAAQGSQPTNTVNLPPSLSKAAAAKSAHDNSGASPQDIWAYANKR